MVAATRKASWTNDRRLAHRLSSVVKVSLKAVPDLLEIQNCKHSNCHFLSSRYFSIIKAQRNSKAAEFPWARSYFSELRRGGFTRGRDCPSKRMPSPLSSVYLWSIWGSNQRHKNQTDRFPFGRMIPLVSRQLRSTSASEREGKTLAAKLSAQFQWCFPLKNTMAIRVLGWMRDL